MRKENRGWKIALSLIFLFVCAGGGLLVARSSAPPTERTGDFGELNCTACHAGNPLNAAGGTFNIAGVPPTYQPGTTYPITVSIQKAGQARWGFELAVRAVSTQQQAGTLTAANNTQIQTANAIQYISHTAAGTFAGTTTGGSWTFNWTAPSPAVGAVRFGAAGNAANNNNANSGDFIYTTTVTSEAPAVARPVTALFAHLAVGQGFSTIFTLMNTGSAPVEGELFLTGQDGSPLSVTLSEPSITANEPAANTALASSTTLLIPPGGTRFVSATPLSPSDSLKAGWARLESTGGTPSGVATFQLTSGGRLSTIAGVLAAETEDNVTIPVDDDVAAERFTGFAVANPSSEAITIRVVTVREDGTVAATLQPISLGPGEQKAQFLFQDPGASQKFKGSVVLMGQNSKRFSVVALVQDQGLYTAIPVVSGKAPGVN